MNSCHTNYAATLIDTCNPNRCARSTTVSNRNSLIFPLNNAPTRGWVMCSTSAASCCLRPRELMASESVIINSEGSLRFSCRTGSSSSAPHTRCVFLPLMIVSLISLSIRVSPLPNPACSFSDISFERHATSKLCLQPNHTGDTILPFVLTCALIRVKNTCRSLS